MFNTASRISFFVAISVRTYPQENILQSLYRLRQINNEDENKRPSIDYYYANIDIELNIDNLI